LEEVARARAVALRFGLLSSFYLYGIYLQEPLRPFHSIVLRIKGVVLLSHVCLDAVEEEEALHD